MGIPDAAFGKRAASSMALYLFYASHDEVSYNLLSLQREMGAGEWEQT